MKRFIFLSLIVLLFLAGCADRNTTGPKETTAPPSETNTNNEHQSTEKTEIPETEAAPETIPETEGNTAMPQPTVYKPLNHKNFKAIWLSQFDLEKIYTSNGKQTNKDAFTTKIHRVLDHVKENGFNTVILQVRPYADSFYPSEYYPASKYVSGSYETKLMYDPLPIIIEYAHSLDISVHAWINPMRGMTEAEVVSVDDSFAVKKWYNSKNSTKSLVSVLNGRLYLDPAYEDTRELIINGVKEIIDNYDFDGVHMDDYFYPTADAAFDRVSYTSYTANGGKDSLKQYRYNNVNKLVSGIYSAVKEKNTDLIFGISPEGNIKNVTEKAFADVITWMTEDGYIDYICPQIYYGLEHGTLPFDQTLKYWSSLIKNKNVRLIAGMTLGKALSKTDQWAGSGKNEWAEHNDVLKRCLDSTLSVDRVYGISMFCYQYYYNPSTFEEVLGTKEERDRFTPALKDINWN